MAKGLVGISCNIPGGLHCLYVNDVARDKLQTSSLISGTALNINGIIEKFSEFFEEGALWWTKPVHVYNQAMADGISPIFPNVVITGNTTYTIDDINLACNTGELSTRLGMSVGVLPSIPNPISKGYTLMGAASISFRAYEVTVAFPIFRASEIDFNNKKLNITSETDTLSESCWIELTWNNQNFNWSVNWPRASSDVNPMSVLYNRLPELGIVPYTNYIGSRDDPYGEGGTSGPGGGPGTGTFDVSSDTIGLPPLPTLSFAATGFTRIYNPTLAQLNSLANYLWTDQTFLDTVINHLKQLLENPMDAVISLSLLPCSIPNGAPEAVKVMYINTGVSMAPATTQFVDVDCGTYSLEEFYGSALDYNPYTKVHCYLPYIGQVTLDTDEVMGRTLNVVYRIDIVTGMCAAMILVDQNVLYQFSGHCAINMPINSADFSGYIGAAMTAGKMVAGIAAGAAGLTPLAAELVGAPTPHATTTHTMDTTRSTDLIRNEDTHRQTERRTRTVTSPEVSFGELARKSVANSVGAVMGSKVSIQHAGGFTGNSGYLAVRRPYLIIERPRMCNPEEYGRYNGRPSMIYMNLGECEGYTEVQSIQFENIPATNPELAELSELLKSGVLF